jgi:type I restriction enzyme S subunit
MSSHAGRQTWTTVRLGDIGRIVSGATPRTDNPAYWEGDILWVTPKDLSGHDTAIITETGKAITAAGLASCSAEQLPVGTVLFSSRAPIGLTAITGAPMATNQGFKSVVPGPGIDSHFLYWALRHFGPSIAKRAPGTTFKEVNKAAMEDVRIPLPPLSEQRRVAALLDKADAIRRKRQQAIRLADDLLRSAFLDMFGDPITNPKGWPVARLGDAIESIEAGWSAAGEERARRPGERAVLKISAVTSGWFRPEEAKVVEQVGDEATLVTPRRGDVLFSRANTRELVAATCLVDRDEPTLFLPDKLWRIMPRADRCNGEYLRFLLANHAFRGKVSSCATGTSGSMLNVSQEKVLGLSAPFPPMPLQHRFRTAVWAALSVREEQICAEKTASILFHSLVHRVFAQASGTRFASNRLQ